MLLPDCWLLDDFRPDNSMLIERCKDQRRTNDAGPKFDDLE